MAGTPRYKLFAVDGEYVGSAKWLEVAAMFVASLGEGAQVRDGHRKVLWTEGEGGVWARESYDDAREVMLKRQAQAA